MLEEKNILLEKSNGMAIITMNRPLALNSLHPDLIDNLLEALNIAEKDNDIRVVVLTGAGKAFCAGGDLPYIESITSAVLGREYIIHAGKIITTIVNLEKPVIAMVNGVAAGAGFNLALACDIIYCAKSAKFGQSFSRVGLIPDCGGTYLLPRLVGLHKAKELMFTADLISAEEALRLGLVNQVVDDNDLKEVTYKFAQRLANFAPIALSLIKKVVNKTYNFSLDDALELEADLQSICLQTEDNKEGIKAFKEKRAPIFKGK
ncbi:MAG: 2-(1,2-epoxy,2-dihydrophenyl)acetyl-CoA isomerase [Clostridia bacterium]|jgi:2-(1,2-epoxy-1,2-dihydrophenyl)acetyl-CoA isomerase|nr:2-(1,2-epoxy,2-dihydrophenyl)acetyl-CoA isomerase [Clostridia bacterium]MDN5323776.1 2-(1,2-epoxy,2-dihydrophenyl)acetyl-CoA isomerase [Clostridia bacterium]